ncbi:hypothetical protein WISP_139277 [Willisornis vidua]|uniref:Uncharacterized protein n=1 Tax=Willisornis vidua TaxID=1566151 RepID=A0ABQ9CMH9_9PASS|nr:hypothetical protein WISP_139277 [Willisornis vidua]
MDFVDIKDEADFKQEASIEDPASLIFQEGFSMDIPEAMVWKGKELINIYYTSKCKDVIEPNMPSNQGENTHLSTRKQSEGHGQEFFDSYWV